MKFKLKLLFILSAVTLFFALPQRSFSALEQPPGEFPITKPLKPIEPGAQPNYSGNIQDGEPVILEGTGEESPSVQLNQPQQTTIDPVTGQPVITNQTVADKRGSGRIWAAGIILLIVVGTALWLWRKKKPSSLASVLVLAIAGFSVAFLSVEASLALAQSEPRVTKPNQNSNEPIQRTITSEEEITITEKGSKADFNKALYAITTVALLAVAGGAMYFYWVKTPAKDNPTPSAPPRL